MQLVLFFLVFLLPDAPLETLPAVEVLTPAAEQHGATYSVIWLHGLGADGHDFEPIVPQLGLDDVPVRFVFPHAPVRPVTLNMNMPMRAWYDITSLDRDASEDEAGLQASASEVNKLLLQEAARSVPAQNIILAGFSQGGAVALYAGLRQPEKLAGIMGLSTYLPLRAKLAEEAHAANQSTPVWMAHGSYDPVVPYAYGQLSYELLKSADYDISWQSYPIEHNVSLDEIRHIGLWLRERFTAGQGSGD